jgi:hypothetical protein
MMRGPVGRATLSVWIVAMAAAAASAQTNGQQAVVASSGAAVQGFSVVLVVGALQANGEKFAGDLPRGATKALSDMTDFLPYRSYRLLDSAWVLSSGSGRMTSRMRGSENRAYDVILETAPAASRLGVSFALRDAADSGATDGDRAKSLLEAQAVQAETESLKLMVARLEAELQDLRGKLGASHPEATRKSIQILESKRRLDMLNTRGKRWKTDGPAGRIIDTSFIMDPGETVVVGTSRLQGDTALIVLLTAVPRASK